MCRTSSPVDGLTSPYPKIMFGASSVMPVAVNVNVSSPAAGSFVTDFCDSTSTLSLRTARGDALSAYVSGAAYSCAATTAGPNIFP